MTASQRQAAPSGGGGIRTHSARGTRFTAEPGSPTPALPRGRPILERGRCRPVHRPPWANLRIAGRDLRGLEPMSRPDTEVVAEQVRAANENDLCRLTELLAENYFARLSSGQIYAGSTGFANWVRDAARRVREPPIRGLLDHPGRAGVRPPRRRRPPHSGRRHARGRPRRLALPRPRRANQRADLLPHRARGVGLARRAGPRGASRRCRRADDRRLQRATTTSRSSAGSTGTIASTRRSSSPGTRGEAWTR